MTHKNNKDPLQKTAGDTFSDTIRFTDSDGDPIDITGWVIYVTVKRSLQDSDANAVLKTDVSSHDDAVNGQTSYSFSGTMTEDLDGAYFFEVKYQDDLGNIETIVSRRLEFNSAVRKSI